MKNKVLFVGQLMLQRYNIIGTNVLMFEAWELDKPAPGKFHSHSTITYHLDANNILQCWGLVGTHTISPEIAKMPLGNERIAAVFEYYQSQYNAAYALLWTHFPESRKGDGDMGKIALTLD